jgi:hypothetical protein
LDTALVVSLKYIDVSEMRTTSIIRAMNKPLGKKKPVRDIGIGGTR